MWQFLTAFGADGDVDPADDPNIPLDNPRRESLIALFHSSPENIKLAKQRAFLESLSLGRFDVTLKLLKEPTGGISISIDDVIDPETGNTALGRACDRWEIDQLKFLLDNGANVDATNFQGETALIRRCDQLSDYKIIHLLVKNGSADVDVLSQLGDVDNALARAFSSRRWTNEQETEYDNCLHTFFHFRILKLLIKSGATLARDPLNVTDYFGAQVMPQVLSRFYAVPKMIHSRMVSNKSSRYTLSKADVQNVVRPLVLKLLLAARHRSSINVHKFRETLDLSTFRRQYPDIDLQEFAFALQAQFPLKLQELARFAVLSQLPTGYKRRMNAVGAETLKLPENLRAFLKFRDIKDLLRLLEQKAIYGVGTSNSHQP